MNSRCHKYPSVDGGQEDWIKSNSLNPATRQVSLIILLAAGLICTGCSSGHPSTSWVAAWCSSGSSTAVTYGDRAGSAQISLAYGCSDINGWDSSGDMECMKDPLVPVSTWARPEWTVQATIQFPAIMTGCDISEISMWLVFDAAVIGAPVTGTVYPLIINSYRHEMLVTYGYGDNIGPQAPFDTNYRLISGELVAVEVVAESVTFELRNLAFERLNGWSDEPNEYGCYLPETIVIDDVTNTCVPEFQVITEC